MTGPRHAFGRMAHEGPSPLRRAALGSLIMVAAIGLVDALSLIWNQMDWPTLILFAAAIAVGIYVGNWFALPAAYVGLVATSILLDVGLYVIMGSSWWEQQNAGHYPGAEPAYLKLLGDLLEYAVFGLFFAALAAPGVLVRRLVGRWTAKR